MKFSGYNLINQRLDSEWLIKLLRFCSNDYSGAIGEDENSDPLTFSEETGNFELSPCTLAVGGHTVDMTEETEDESISGTIISSGNNFFGIALGLDADKVSTNITTNDLTNVKFGFIDGFTIKQIRSEESGELTGYFEIKNTSNQGWDRYHYDTQKFDTISIRPYNTEISESMSNVYIIPVAGFDTETQKPIRLLGYKTGSALEEFLTKAALDKLIDMLNDRYVWREGGANISERGNIGNLNITHNTIKPKSKEADNIILKSDSVRLVHTSTGVYDEGAIIYRNNPNDSYPTKIETISKLPIKFGGTNASNFWDARKNLKIITSADRGVTNNGKAPTQYNAPEGTIYLSIVE